MHIKNLNAHTHTLTIWIYGKKIRVAEKIVCSFTLLTMCIFTTHMYIQMWSSQQFNSIFLKCSESNSFCESVCVYIWEIYILKMRCGSGTRPWCFLNFILYRTHVLRSRAYMHIDIRCRCGVEYRIEVYTFTINSHDQRNCFIIFLKM